MQSSGATLVALLLAQSADAVALLDVFCGEPVPLGSDFPADRAAIAKVTITTAYDFDAQRARFAPDRAVLVLRHPCHAYVSLARKGYATMGGTLDEKLSRFEQTFRDRDAFDAVVFYEDLVFRPAVALEQLGLGDAALGFPRSPAEIVADARTVPALEARYQTAWGRGNADGHGLDPRRVFKVIPTGVRDHVGARCPEATAAFEQFYGEMFPAWRVALGGWWDDALAPRLRGTVRKSRQAARRVVHAGRQ
jgi:hypothetical protein